MSTALLVAMAAAGSVVLAATALARRMPGPWAGVLGALPVTPTLAALWLRGGLEATFFLRGTSTVCGVLLGLWIASRFPTTRGLVAGWIAMPLAAAGLAWLPWPVALGSAAVAAIVLGHSLHDRPLPVTAARRSLPAWSRFALGALSVGAVAAAAAAAPWLAPVAAMAPVLLLASLAATGVDQGAKAAIALAPGAVTASMGILAFAFAFLVAYPLGFAWALLLAWVAFATVVLVWGLWERHGHAPTVGVDVLAA